MAAQHVELWREVSSGNLLKAQLCHDRLYPLVETFYRAPWINLHTRMKEALVMMGVLKTSVVRPPLLPLTNTEKKEIRAALETANLL